MRKFYAPHRIVSTLAIAFYFISSLGNAQKAEPNGKLKWAIDKPFEHKVFIENKGQFSGKDGIDNSNIQYGVTLGKIQMYFTPQGLTYRHDEFTKGKVDGEEREEAMEKAAETGKKVPQTLIPDFVYMTWEGSNPDVEIVPDNAVSYYFTYPDVNDETYKATFTAQAFNKITYRNLYPNIDVEYYFPEGREGIKYSIILHPGADPSVIKMKYSGKCDPTLDVNGDLILKSSPFGEFTDHAPSTYYSDDNGAIVSSFTVKNKIVSFHLENADNSKAIVIDPWTTNPNFTSFNSGYDVEYDIAGNCYCYGGNWPWQEIKFNPAGGISWVYTAALLYSSGCSGPCYGDFCVDGTSGSAYLVEGFNGGVGCRVIKVNNGGTQVGVFPGNNNFGEMWRAVFNNCTHTAIIAGGGTSMTYQACVLDTTVTNMTPVNVLNAITALHDMCLLTLDNNNDCYMGSAKSQSDPNNFDNIMLKCPGATLTPNTWLVPDGHAFVEVASVQYVNNTTSDANGFNGMAVSPSFLYTYDGSTLKKWNKNSGTLVTTLAISPTPFQFGGLDVDECDNLYVGTATGVACYNAGLQLVNTLATSNSVFDVTIGANNQLYACGNGFVENWSLTTVCNSLNLSITGAGNCSSGTATVTPTGGVGPYTYVWSTSPPQYTATVTGLTPGTYTVWVTDNSCVPQTQMDTIVITASGSLSSTPTQLNVACAAGCNGTATLTPGGGQGPYTYLWTPTGQTTQTATNLCAGNYSCTATDVNGCTVTQTFTITEPPPLTISSAGFNVSCNGACDGQIVAIPGGGSPNYSFLWSSGCTTASCSNVCAGTYNVTLTDANGCTITSTTTVTQPPGFVINTTTTPSNCTAADGSAMATYSGGTGALSATWYNPPTVNDTLANIPAGNYFVVVTDANGCSDTAFATVSNVPGVVASLGSVTNILCHGGNNGQITVTDNNINSPYTYSWSCSPSITNTASNLTAGTCTVTLTDITGCTSTVTATVTEPPQLTLNATATPPAVCLGQPVQLNCVGAGGTPIYQYAWAPGNLIGGTQNIVPPVTATYTAYVTDANLCVDSTMVTVTVNDNPVSLLIGDSLSGCAPLCVNFTDLSSVNAPSTITQWSWDFGDNSPLSTSQNPTHCYNIAGVYTVNLTVSTGAGCTNTITMTNYINVFANPIASFSATPQRATQLEPEISFTDLSTNAFTWSWDFGDTSATSSLQNPTHSYANPGCYDVILTVTTQNGCRDTSLQEVCMDPDVAIYVPNAFTPNGDGTNDLFFPKGVGLDENRYELWIFDRWGNLIFETKDWNQGWNGCVQGTTNPCQIDTYVWKIKVYDMLNKKHSLIGKVSIVR